MNQLNVDQVPPSEARAAQEVASVVLNAPDVVIPQVEKPAEPVAEAPVENPIEPEKMAPEVSEEPKKKEAQPAPEASHSEPATAPEASAEPAQEAAPSAKGPQSDDVLVARLGEVLKTVDLGVTTEKMLRRQLETEFGAELSSKKALIRGEIEKYLQAQADNRNADEEEEESDEEEEEKATGSRKRSRGGGGGASRFGDILSEAMSTFLGMERCPRTQVVKKLWEYIKANDLQNPKDRRQILLDDKLKTIFPGKSVTMFSMQKHLSKHVFTADVSESEDESEDDEGSDVGHEKPKAAKKKKVVPAPRNPKKPAGSSTRGVNKNGAPAKPNGFTKPVKLAPDLAAWMGSETASRPEITKKVWAYIKQRNLQDPSNKQYALSDETLKTVDWRG
ncbi:hypothetical protein Ndes2526B_g04612 [Nannochloris sp. 'desiccata']